MLEYHRFVEEVGGKFLANATPPCDSDLKEWKPSHRPWPLMRSVQHSLSGLRRRTTMIDGSRFVWLEGGKKDGDCVVLIHGFGTCKENWLPLVPFLKANYRLIVPDLPGWGESHFKHNALYGMDHQVARVGEWIEHHFSEPVHLVGNSMGGAIAGFVAARYPASVSSLTLMNAAGVIGEKMTGFEKGLLVGNNSLVAKNARMLKQILMTATHRNRALISAVFTPVMAPMALARKSINEHLFLELMRYPACLPLSGLNSISVPTLIMWGDKDNILDVSCADIFSKEIPHAKKVILRGVGHLPMIEAPTLTARYLKRFWVALDNEQ